MAEMRPLRLLAFALGNAGTVVTHPPNPTDLKALINTSKFPVTAVETVSVHSDAKDQKMTRYFTLLDLSPTPLSTSEDEVWVLARNGEGPDGCRQPFIQLWTDGRADAPLKPDSKSSVVMPDLIVGHNFGATVAADGAIVAAGGMYSGPSAWEITLKMNLPHMFSNGGIYFFRAGSREEALKPEWLTEKASLSAVPGNHPGCIERREAFDGNCAFDGRVSIMSHRGYLLLYARANTVFKGGGRYVQVTAARSAQGPWDSWRLIQIESYDDAKIEAGNIYCASMNPNPVDPDVLLGLFPVIEGETAFMALALSCDGVRFSRLKRFLKSDIVKPRGNEKGGNRGVDHPVDGIIQRGDNIYFYVQRNVPGIATSGGPSRIIRLTISRQALAAYTADWKAKLQKSGRCGSMESAWTIGAEEAGEATAAPAVEKKAEL